MQTVKKVIHGDGRIEFVPITRREWADAIDSLSPDSFGSARFNAQGDVSSASLGYKYVIDTLTYIIPEVVKQKFYTVTPSDFIPVEVGRGGLSDAIVTNLQYSSGGSFFDGLIPVGTSDIRLPSVTSGIAPKSIDVNQWAKSLGWNIVEVQQAMYNNRWDVIEGNLIALKTNYDLGIQQVAFLGDPNNLTRTPGLLTNTDINTDVSTITEPISGMSSTEFQNFVGTILPSYTANSNVTETSPDLFIMPLSDYQGLGRATSDGFPIGTKLQYLLDTFRQMTGNPNFQIKGLAYADAARNPDGKNIYMLIKRNSENYRMDIQIPFTLLAPNTPNNFAFQQVALSRFTGVGVYRPLEILKYEYTPGS